MVCGKFLHAGSTRFLIRGVSYGTFAPADDGSQFPSLDRVAHDFAAIAELGANTVRTYTSPPLAVLDEAARRDLRMISGVPWAQHVAFLDDARSVRNIRRTVRDSVKRLASHSATLLFTIGNEIPPGIVRWYGRKRIEQFMRELFEEAKAAAPDALVTYVNYPPTEYLDLSFFDICAFNIFLHAQTDLSAYLVRLQHLAGRRPLLIAEAGADSLRHGPNQQAALVAMQVRTAFREGAAGTVVFSWTDEWWRSGRPVDDWAFGLVDTRRQRKPAYRAVQDVFHSAPFQTAEKKTWPRVTVVVCAYNAAGTIEQCLTAIEGLQYPDFECVVVNDGSTDDTGAVAARHPRVKLIETTNGGLSAARNLGLEHATGDIVAYTDADVRVDPDWLTYLVQPFLHSDVVAAGGPNIVPPDDPWLAQCVARAPGSPMHVLLEDRLAEHIPGCNCAFRREALMGIGGFNPIFRRAGDDVDVCWRLQSQGGKIGFAPAALVWHHHRNSIQAFLRQQVGYGEGEAWLMHEHPHKFIGGRIAWTGHIYSSLPFIRSLSETRINAGPFGSKSFPSIYRTDPHPLAYIAHSGRWQIGWALLIALAVVTGFAHQPYAYPLLAAGLIALATTGANCLHYGLLADLSDLPSIGRLARGPSAVLYRLTIALFHFLQPFARLYGRVRGAIWRPAFGPRRQTSLSPVTSVALADGMRLLCGRELEKRFWSDSWIDVQVLLSAIADRLRQHRAIRHIELDSGWWEARDVTIVNRLGLPVDMRALVEDHGAGRSLCRLRIRLRLGVAFLPLLLAVTTVMLLDASGLVAWPISTTLAVLLAGAATAAETMTTWRILATAIQSVKTDFGMLAIETDPPAPGREPAGVSDQPDTTAADPWSKNSGPAQVPSRHIA